MRTATNGESIFIKECDLHRNCGMAVIFFSLLFNYDNLILKLNQKKDTATVMKDGFLLAGPKLEIFQELVFFM